MTLPKDKNHMATEFVDAYWAITELSYDFSILQFKLACFPSREAKQLDGTNVEDPSIEGYGSCQSVYRPELYSWTPYFGIEDVFPDGIPLGRDAQLTIIYGFIKEYTGLPFEDVLEGDQVVEEPEEEPLAFNMTSTEEQTDETPTETPVEEINEVGSSENEEDVTEDTPIEEENENV